MDQVSSGESRDLEDDMYFVFFYHYRADVCISHLWGLNYQLLVSYFKATSDKQIFYCMFVLFIFYLVVLDFEKPPHATSHEGFIER